MTTTPNPVILTLTPEQAVAVIETLEAWIMRQYDPPADVVAALLAINEQYPTRGRKIVARLR